MMEYMGIFSKNSFLLKGVFLLVIWVLSIAPTKTGAITTSSMSDGNWTATSTWNPAYVSAIGTSTAWAQISGFSSGYPSKLFVDSTSNSLYVSDSNRIQITTQPGNVTTVFGNSYLTSVTDTETDSSGNLYIVDSTNSRLAKFNSSMQFEWMVGWGVATGANQFEKCTVLNTCQNGTYGSGDGQLGSISGIAIDSSGYIYLAQYGQHRIQKFDSSGNFVTKWGTQGSGNGQLDAPNSISIDSSDNVYVSEINNARVQKFSSTGTYITKWGSFGTGNGQFQAIAGVAADSSGNVYVVEQVGNRVQKFNSSGTYVTQWGTSGSGNGQFSAPQGIATDSSGNVYVADTNNARVQKFTSAGVYTTSFLGYPAYDAVFQPKNSAINSSQEIYVIENANFRVHKFDSSGNHITAWGSSGTGNSQFQSLDGIAVDSTGNVYVADSIRKRVQKFNSSGTYVTQWGTSGSGNGQFSSPIGIAIDSSDNVYVVDSGNNRVQKFNSSGTYVTQWGTFGTGNGQFSIPQGVAVDSTGNVYVTDMNNNRIQKFNSSGTYVTQWGTSGTGNGQLSGPKHIWVDAQNSVYVSEYYNNRIQKFTSSGVYITKWTIGAPGESSYFTEGLKTDNQGNLFIADSSNHKVKKFASQVPSTTDDVTINNSVTLTATTTVNNLTVASGATLNLNGFPLIINGTIDNQGTISSSTTGYVSFASSTYDLAISSALPVSGYVRSVSILSGGTLFVAGAGLQTATTTVYSGGTLNLNSTPFTASSSLVISGSLIGSGDVNFSSSSNVTIGGSNNTVTLLSETTVHNLVISSGGTLDLNGNTLTVTGDWTNGGVFIANQGTVIFSGTENTISGENTFYNLIKTETSSSTLYFSPSASTTILGQLNLSGTSGNPLVVGMQGSTILIPHSTFGSLGTGNGQFNTPHEVAVDSNGDLYVSDTKNNRIQKFTSSGTFISKFGSSGTGAGQFANPLGIAFDSSGNIYVADNKNYRVQKFDTNHNFLKMWGWGVATGADQFEVCTSSCRIGLTTSNRDVNGMMWNPHGIKVGPNGNVFVTQYYGNSRPANSVLEFTPEGVFVSKWGPWPSGQSYEGTLNGGYGIGFDSDGDIYVVNAYGYRVDKFDSNHNFLKMWGWGVATGADQFEICTSSCRMGTQSYGNGGFRYIPTGLAIDNDNNIYVAQNYDSNIQKYSSEGVFMGRYESFGSQLGQLNNPYGISFDAGKDYLYVADGDNNRIQKFINGSNAVIRINPVGSVTVSNISVSNVVNTGPVSIICTSGCVDSGKNSGWVFSISSSPTVSARTPVIGPVGGSSSNADKKRFFDTETKQGSDKNRSSESSKLALIPPQDKPSSTGKGKSPAVVSIQKILNSDPETQVSKKGPGSPGKETDIYGPATKKAVGKFQIKYGIVKSPKDPGYGVVGPKTRKKMNEIVNDKNRKL